MNISIVQYYIFLLVQSRTINFTKSTSTCFSFDLPSPRTFTRTCRPVTPLRASYSAVFVQRLCFKTSPRRLRVYSTYSTVFTFHSFSQKASTIRIATEIDQKNINNNNKYL